MRRPSFFHLVGLLVVLVVLSLPSPAVATGVGGWGGHAIYYVNEITAPCFTEMYGAVTYPTGNLNCSGSYYWEVALLKNSGSYNPTVEVGWPSGQSASGYIQCQNNAMPQNGSSASGSFSGFYYPSGTSGLAHFQPGSVTVPSYGYLFVNCEMSAGATLYSVNG